MTYWIYTTIIPFVIIFLSILFYRPLTLNRISKGLLISLVPLIFYITLVYFLEIEEYVDSGWLFYTLLFFFLPYLVLVFFLNILTWIRRKKGKTIKN
jgi:hypothetical protein